MQIDLGFIQNKCFAVTSSVDMVQDLKPDLDAVSGPNQFPRNPTALLSVIYIQDGIVTFVRVMIEIGKLNVI